MERLQKALARAGIASRRASEVLIREGRVAVNGTTVTELGTRVDPNRDVIKVDGRRIPRPPASHTYLALHKPRGYVTTASDPQGRPTVQDLIGERRVRVFPVGRLDYSSEGLLLVTDDGDLARALMHPGSGVPKTYLVKIRGTPGPEALSRLRRGIRLDGRRTLPARVRITRPGLNPWLEITVVEGRKRQVRRMLEAVGHQVVKLKRTRYDGIALGSLPPGKIRRLTDEEITRLRQSIRGRSGARSTSRRRGKPA
jgi:23S rRNA pseudouridine2605 synthase/16S rRNA pseudouridine516 synthase